MDSIVLPPLLAEYEPTRATLHAYAHAVEAVPRAHGITHPRWWHVGLEVRPEGLVTDPVPLPGGGALALRMDLTRHEIVARSSTGSAEQIDMRAGLTGTEMADRILVFASEHGLATDVDRGRFESDSAREYDPAAAGAYLEAFTNARGVFDAHRAGLGDRVGPIQVWPHGFDLSFEWFGTRMVETEGERSSSQLNLGFYPAGDPYFYSSPWPFDESLTTAPLPPGAVWNTDGWSGARLPYSPLVGDPAAGSKVADFARAVFAAAAPTLGA